MSLTNDSKAVLYILYSEYRNRRKLGFSKSFSKTFGSAEKIQKDFCSNKILEDVEDSLRELGRNDFLNNFYADDTVTESELTDFAICTLEEQSRETLSSLINFVKYFLLR